MGLLRALAHAMGATFDVCHRRDILNGAYHIRCFSGRERAEESYKLQAVARGVSGSLLRASKGEATVLCVFFAIGGSGRGVSRRTKKTTGPGDLAGDAASPAPSASAIRRRLRRPARVVRRDHHIRGVMAAAPAFATATPSAAARSISASFSPSPTAASSEPRRCRGGRRTRGRPRASTRRGRHLRASSGSPPSDGVGAQQLREGRPRRRERVGVAQQQNLVRARVPIE